MGRHFRIVLLVLDENETEATQDNSSLFSEIQLSGEVEGTTSTGTDLDRDIRFRRLRRSTTIDRRTSHLLSRGNSVAEIEKVNTTISSESNDFLFL